MDISTLKEIVLTIQALTTIVAIAVGGAWSYILFVRRRQRYPRAIVQHKMTHWPIADNKVLLHVTTTVSNPGDVLLVLGGWEMRIQKVRPTPPNVLAALAKGCNPVPEGELEVNWPVLEQRESKCPQSRFEIEPGESQSLDYDYFLDAEVQTVAVYSYFKNVAKRNREMGWDAMTLYELERTSLTSPEKIQGASLKELEQTTGPRIMGQRPGPKEPLRKDNNPEPPTH